jgi:hypothetical protein
VDIKCLFVQYLVFEELLYKYLSIVIFIKFEINFSLAKTSAIKLNKLYHEKIIILFYFIN